VGRPSGIPVLDKRLQNLTVVRKDAEAALRLSKKRMQTDVEQRMKPYVTFFLLTTVHITDYHWDRHLYFVIHSYHAQTMTHTPPSDDSLLVHLLVVPAACDSD
jgi:hypothetical protein